MTHRIIHIGDTHLQAAHPRNGDRLDALDQILAHARDLAAKEQLAVIVWPGDLFHAKSTVEDRNALAARLQHLASCAPVLICYGNHDQPNDLDIFAKLQTVWPIYVVDRPRVVHVESATGAELACFVLPYPHKAGLVTAGIEHAELGQDARGLLDPVFMAAAAELAQADPNEIPMMIGHVNVGGSVSSTGQPQIGTEIELDPGLLARLGPIYKGLNHIHKHQAITGAVYAGSICRLDFAEMEPKGFIEIEYQRDGKTWEHRWRFVPLDVPKMIHVDGDLSRERFLIDSVDGEPVSHGPETPGLVLVGGEWNGADVRCRYRYVQAEIGALDVAKVHAEFAGCRSLKLDGIPVLEHQVRAPEIVAAATLPEKVRAYADRHGVVWSEGIESKLAALLAVEHDELQQRVAAQAAAAGTVTAEPIEVAS